MRQLLCSGGGMALERQLSQKLALDLIQDGEVKVFGARCQAEMARRNSN